MAQLCATWLRKARGDPWVLEHAGASLVLDPEDGAWADMLRWRYGDRWKCQHPGEWGSSNEWRPTTLVALRWLIGGFSFQRLMLQPGKLGEATQRVPVVRHRKAPTDGVEDARKRNLTIVVGRDSPRLEALEPFDRTARMVPGVDEDEPDEWPLEDLMLDVLPPEEPTGSEPASG